MVGNFFVLLILFLSLFLAMLVVLALLKPKVEVMVKVLCFGLLEQELVMVLGFEFLRNW